MSKIAAIRSANAAFAAKGVTNPVAVFVGATSGIGEAAMKAYAEATVAPTIYFVGRNADAAESITASLRRLNPRAKITFLQADLSLLRNTRATAESIRANEASVNLLFMSPGYMSLEGRAPTAEGLEKKLVINYYTRLLFAATLLPELEAAQRQQQPDKGGARVVNVYASGTEGPMISNDWELDKTFSLGQVAKQAAAFTSLALEHLASLHPDIGFVHTYPGVVNTNLLRGMPGWARAVTAGALAPFSVSIADSGQGMLRLSTDERWRKGLSLVDWKGDDRDTRNKAAGMFSFGGGGWWKEGLAEETWRHTLGVFERVLGKAV